MLTRFRVAAVSQSFKTMVARLADQRVYVAPVKKKVRPALTVYRQFDPQDDDGTGGYYFSERAGRDSVAFLLYDAERGDSPFGVLTQWHGPLRRFVTGAYTGSLDKPGLQLEQIVQEEAMEEAGYHITPDRAQYLGAEPVSGQCNETCHMFLVDVTGIGLQAIHPENPFEANTWRTWRSLDDVLIESEWKGKLIALSAVRHMRNS